MPSRLSRPRQAGAGRPPEDCPDPHARVRKRATDERGRPGERAATFSIVADHDPQLLCRLLGTIAQQDRLVRAMTLSSTTRRQRVRIGLADIDLHRAEILAERMRRFVHVRSVRLLWR